MDFKYKFSSSTSSPSSQETSSPSHTSTTISPKRKAGRKKFKETRHPIYRGVRQRNGEKWVCEVSRKTVSDLSVPVSSVSEAWVSSMFKFPTPSSSYKTHSMASRLQLLSFLCLLDLLTLCSAREAPVEKIPKSISNVGYIALIKRKTQDLKTTFNLDTLLHDHSPVVSPSDDAPLYDCGRGQHQHQCGCFK